jgi:hypothetical protein
VRMFHWYLVPLLPCYWLYVGLGLAALGARLRASPTALVAAGLVVAGLWDVAALGVSRGWLDRPTYPLGLSLAREHAYSSAAVDLAPRLGADDVVAAPEIGAFGYVSGARILDTVGLVSPQATRYYPLPAEMLLGDNAVPPALIQDSQPAYVVALDQFVRQSLQPSPWFQQHYALVARYPARVWLSDEVLVYRRVSAP